MSTPNFGYLKDPEDKNRWRIDPAAAETVRRIFELAASGNNPNQIAGMLREEQRMTPGAYFAERGQRNRCNNKKKASAYGWSRSMVTSLLRAREYLGETVNFKTAKTSYKAKRVATQRGKFPRRPSNSNTETRSSIGTWPYPTVRVIPSTRWHITRHFKSSRRRWTATMRRPF